MAFDNRCYAIITVVINDLSTDYSVSFDHNKNWLFDSSFAPLVSYALFLAGLATKVLLVDLYNTANSGKCLVVHVHHFPDGVSKLPGGLLRDADQPGQYYRRDPFAGAKDVVHGQHPSPKWQLGPMHRRLGGNR